MSHPLFPLGLPSLAVDRLYLDDDDTTLMIEAHATNRSAPCPKCQHVSDRVHTRYVRSPRDVPVAEHAVRFVLHVRRFACRNPDCPKRTLAERLPEVVPAHAQRTSRLTFRLQMPGLALGGRAGTRLGHRLSMPLSRDTLLRVVRLVDTQQRPAPRVLGVDDFALQNGHAYGTILVDLEQHWPIDVLAERGADILKTWLQSHSGVEVITRDRSTEYARGATEGAPQALQVADRWHLLANLREALERFLARIYGRLRELPLDAQDAQMMASLHHGASRPLRGPSPSEQVAREARRGARITRWETARGLFLQGMPIRQIARHLDLSWTTARNLAHAETYPERSPKQPQASLINPYVEYLTRRWDEGCHNASQLWRELQERGFEGARVQVARWTSQQRKTPAATTPRKYVLPEMNGPQTPKRDQATLSGSRQLVWLLLRPEEKLDAAELATLHHLRQDHEVVLAQDLARSFQGMVRRRRAMELDGWLQAAAESEIPELRNFADYLKRDGEAVRAGLTEPWSKSRVPYCTSLIVSCAFRS
jgi:transposase